MFLLAMADGPSGGGSSDDEPSNTNTVVAYLATSESLLAAAVASSGHTLDNLKNAFKATFDDGSYPVISAAENEMLAV